MSNTYNTYNNDTMSMEEIREAYFEKNGCDDGWGWDEKETVATEKKVEPVERNPTDPTTNPGSPQPVLMEATMEIFMIKVVVSPPRRKVVSLTAIMAEEKAKSPKSKSNPDPTIHIPKGKMVKMNLGEFFEEVKKEEKALVEKEAKRARKREARKRRRDAGFVEVKKRVIQRAKISAPDKRQISANRKLVPPTPKTKFVNTTLILKNLPYTGVAEKDLRRFFEKNAGPTKFVNMLTKPDGNGKGIAFIRFETRQASDKGLLMNRFSCEGRTVYVEYANDKRDKK